MIAEKLDLRDVAIVERRMEALRGREGPQVGDFVRFGDGSQERISYRWPESCQTSPGGSFHLGEHGCSFSGSLNPGVPTEKLTRAGIAESGRVWIFHHDLQGAGRGVETVEWFTVWNYDGEANG